MQYLTRKDYIRTSAVTLHIPSPPSGLGAHKRHLVGLSPTEPNRCISPKKGTDLVHSWPYVRQASFTLISRQFHTEITYASEVQPGSNKFRTPASAARTVPTKIHLSETNQRRGRHVHRQRHMHALTWCLRNAFVRKSSTSTEDSKPILWLNDFIIQNTV